MGFFSDFFDDVLGFDPPPEPKVTKPRPPAPTRRTATSNVITGVDATRSFTGQESAGAARTDRTLLVDDEDDIGVGLNV